MRKVRIKKVGVADNALAEAGDAATYRYGKTNEGVSVPVDYTIEGYLSTGIQVGFPVVVARTKRNGIEEEGIFKSSAVTDITDRGFNTKNSIYLLEEIPFEVEACPTGGCNCGH